MSMFPYSCRTKCSKCAQVGPKPVSKLLDLLIIALKYDNLIRLSFAFKFDGKKKLVLILHIIRASGSHVCRSSRWSCGKEQVWVLNLLNSIRFFFFQTKYQLGNLTKFYGFFS